MCATFFAYLFNRTWQSVWFNSFVNWFNKNGGGHVEKGILSSRKLKSELLKKQAQNETLLNTPKWEWKIKIKQKKI